MKYIIILSLILTSLISASIQDLGDIGELKKQLETMKNSSKKVEKQQEKIIAKNFIDKKAVGEVTVQQKSEQMKKSIFQYRNDDSIIKERDSSHISIKPEKLSRYGDSFFKNKNGLNSGSMPIPRNYRINKGDIISIWLYGGRNKNNKLEVDRNGNINIDGVGPLYVYNLQFSKLKKLLENKFQTIYKNTKVNIDLDRTTPIQITIAGEVNSPGIYNLSAFSTIKDALIISNGISPYGSYRDIKLIRDGSVIKKFDIYRLLQKGDISYINYILKNGDGIIVTRSKRIITISGAIRKSGIYELKKNENIKSLISYAGDLKVSANNRLAKLERVDNHKKRVVIDIDLTKHISLKNGDKITILPINYKNSDSIYIYGNIVRTGERGFFEGLTLYNFFKREISINKLDNVFMKNMEMDYSIIKRYNLITFSEEIIKFSLKNILSGKVDIKLSKGDEIYIFNKAELKENPYIYINGLVITAPGKYQYFENMKLGDIHNFIKFKSEIIREGKRRVLQVSKEIKLLRNIREDMEIHFLDLERDQNFSIYEFDEITFFDKLEIENPKLATITGEILSGGQFVIDKNTDINKLIQLGKGLKKEAYLHKFEVVRYKVVDGEREYRVITKSLQEAMDTNFKIEEFDEVKIFKIPKWNDKKSIVISGEVKFPGSYRIKKGDTLIKLVERAGGYLDTAFFDGAVFTRRSIQKLQEKRLRDSVKKLKQDSIYLLSSPSSVGEDSGDKMMLVSMIDSLVLELAEFKPNGRVSLKLNQNTDFILESGDNIHIPTKNETVTVIGEVLNPNAFFFKNGYGVEEYLEKSGGLNQKADIDNIYIVHPNGEAERYEQSYLFGNGSEIRTGDTIIIPIKIETASYSTVAKDVSQILYQFAITAVSLKTVGVF